MACFRSILCIAITVPFIQHAASEIVHVQEVLGPSQAFPATDAIPHDPSRSNEKSIEKRFGFDIDWRQYDEHLTIREALDHFDHSNVSGLIAFVKGEPKQLHTFEVLARASSPSQSTLDCIEFSSDKSELSLTTNSQCTSPPAPLHIAIIIAVRPKALQFGWDTGTRVNTNFLSIVIWRDLSYETYHMALHTTYGDIACHETWAFTAHSISATSDHGSITGNWSLPSSIALTTLEGKIDIDLVPKRWSAGSDTLGDLKAESVSGAIDIRMPFAEDKLSLRNATTNITTHSGAIRADLVHGAITHIQSVSGTINTTLLPYWAFDEFHGVQHNYISTTCSMCNTTVDILTPILRNFYPLRPLYFTRSRHHAGIGRMALGYPMEWAGVAEWKIGIGKASVSGVDYEVLEDTGSSGKIQRRPLGSTLWAEVGAGVFNLTMKG
jgi:hypothetical protein